MIEKSKRNVVLVSIVLTAAFLLIYNLRNVLNLFDLYSELSDHHRYLTFYFIQTILCFFFAFLILKLGNYSDNVYEALGIKSNALKGLFLAFIFSSPMLIGYWLVSGFNNDVSAEDIVFWSIISPFVEELFYRALLIGFLFRYLRLGFIPAAVIVSVIFGLGHLYQANGFMESIGVFGVTLFGSLLFGWLYIEWKFNLWLIFGLHMFMNLYWNIFDIEASNAIGGLAANIFRFTTIGLAIWLTVRSVSKSGSQLKKRWLLLEKA